MNFLKQFMTSIYQFHNYNMLMLSKRASTVIYYILFSVILTALSIGAVARVYYQLGGVNGIFEKYVPEFTISNGKLNCDIVDKEYGGLKIYINTDGEYRCRDKDLDALAYIAADNDGFVVYNGAMKEYYPYMAIGNLTKSELKDFFTQDYVKFTMLFFIFVFTLINHIITGLIGILIIALTGNMINIMFNITDLKFMDFIKLAVYVRTFPALLNSIMACSGFQLPTIIYYGLIITYLYFGLKNVRSASGIIIAQLEE